MWIGLKIGMRQAMRHDKSHRIIRHHMRSGENRHIDPAAGIGSSQHPMPLDIFKIIFQYQVLASYKSYQVFRNTTKK